jgi:hypothetical protein
MRRRKMRVFIKMIDPGRIEERAAAFDAMHFIALLEKKLGQISPILSGHPCNQRSLQNKLP